MTNTSPTASHGGLQTVRNLLSHFRIFTNLNVNLKLFKFRQNDLNCLLDVITILIRQLDSRLQEKNDAGDARQDVGVVTICQFHGLTTCPQSPLKNLIPLVRKMAELRIVFEITINVADAKGETVTRIHRDRRIGPKTVTTHTVRS